MSYEIRTRKDYSFYDCSSAFQKEIRRSNEKKALFFAFELYASGYSKYIWKRMFVIASEDIGLADDSVAVKLNALYNNWKMINETGANGSSVPFVHAVMILARAKKSRICDHAKIYAMKTDDNFDIPDYAYDMHTRKGKQLKRGNQYFLDHGAKLENEIDTNDQFKDFFVQFLNDKTDKRIDDLGYDHRNVVHKTTKDLAKFNKENSQTNLF